MSDERVIHLKGIQNIRDLGSLTGLGGKKIKRNLLIRSSRLYRMESDGFDYFKKINLTTVLDLRTTLEAGKRPDPEIPGVKVYSIRVLDENPNELGSAYGMLARSGSEEEFLVNLLSGGFDMSAVYMNFINQETSERGMKEALSLIANQPEGEALLYHCNGGKDRTGTLTVYLLTILGASERDIMDDFEMTNEFFADEIERLKAAARKMTDNERVIEAMKDIAGVSRSNMEMVVGALKDRYGSVMNYLTEKVGITEDEINTIRNKYLEA